MGMRFRKSINLGGGARVNISKSGIGGSFGVKGARVTKTAKGTTRKTYSIPGTGISHITETSSKKKTANAATAPATLSNKTLSIVFKVLGALMIVFSCLLALVFPTPGVISIIVGVVLVVVGVKCGKKAKQEIKEE